MACATTCIRAPLPNLEHLITLLLATFTLNFLLSHTLPNSLTNLPNFSSESATSAVSSANNSWFISNLPPLALSSSNPFPSTQTFTSRMTIDIYITQPCLNPTLTGNHSITSFPTQTHGWEMRNTRTHGCVWQCVPPGHTHGYYPRPDRKKYSLLRDKYFREDSRICYLHWKSLNMRSEWGNIKEYNKYPCVVLNILGRSGQLMMNPFQTLELLFPISKKECVLVLFQFPKSIVLNFLLRSKIYHSWFLLICKMYRCFVPK